MTEDLGSLSSAEEITASIFKEADGRTDCKPVASQLKELWDSGSWNSDAIEQAIVRAIEGSDED